MGYVLKNSIRNSKKEDAVNRELTQVAYTTSDGRLIYGDEQIGFKRLYRKKQLRYPKLSPGDIEMFRPFIGVSIPEIGYRFYSLEGDHAWADIKNIKM